MTNKPVINYRGVMMDDPSDRTKKICVPQIVDRNQTKTIADIVYSAIDRGLVAGLKPEAAQSIADGIMTQLGEVLNQGTGVLFGDYFAVRPYLSGTIPNLLAQLTAANKLRARFITGGAYRLDERKFSFHNTTESDAVPLITLIQPNENDTEPFTFDVNKDLAVTGENIKMGASAHLKLYNCDGDEPAFIADYDNARIRTNSDTFLLLRSDGLAELASVDRAGFKVERTITVEGVEITVESEMVYATRTDSPTPPVPVDPPRIDGAATQGQEDGVIEAPGGVIDVTGANLATATSVSLYYGDDGASIEDMTHWVDLPATYNPESDILTTDEGPAEDAPDSWGRVRVTTAGGSADYSVSYMVH